MKNHYEAKRRAQIQLQKDVEIQRMRQDAENLRNVGKNQHDDGQFHAASDTFQSAAAILEKALLLLSDGDHDNVADSCKEEGNAGTSATAGDGCNSAATTAASDVDSTSNRNDYDSTPPDHHIASTSSSLSSMETEMAEEYATCLLHRALCCLNCVVVEETVKYTVGKIIYIHYMFH